MLQAVVVLLLKVNICSVSF